MQASRTKGLGHDIHGKVILATKIRHEVSQPSRFVFMHVHAILNYLDEPVYCDGDEQGFSTDVTFGVNGRCSHCFTMLCDAAFCDTMPMACSNLMWYDSISA